MSMTERFGHMRRSRRHGGDAAVAATREAAESAKRQQIIEGARAVFLAQGFDAASMGEIAREAGVSKGTLYVYFDSKEELFEAIVEEECRAQAEQVLPSIPDDHDVSACCGSAGPSCASCAAQPASRRCAP